MRSAAGIAKQVGIGSNSRIGGEERIRSDAQQQDGTHPAAYWGKKEVLHTERTRRAAMRGLTKHLVGWSVVYTVFFIYFFVAVSSWGLHL